MCSPDHRKIIRFLVRFWKKKRKKKKNYISVSPFPKISMSGSISRMVKIDYDMFGCYQELLILSLESIPLEVKI